ncbi:hypothetical protein B6I21_07650 [candidate division KSB1 bacterium 4572_119]|nr:MAG: hypothetical protein B6I21_07650 [candidate division KSB1 bacterium 4572_119]
MKKLFVVFILLLLFVTVIFSQNKNSFLIQDITFDGKVKRYVTMDLNNDSIEEIITFTEEGKNKNAQHYINICWQVDGSFSNNSVQKFRPPAEMIIFDFGDVTIDPGKEFVFLTSNGIYYYTLNSSARYDLNKKFLFKAPTILRNSDKENICYWDFVRDITNDGKAEVLVPQFNNYLIYSVDDTSGWQNPSRLRIRTKTDIGVFNRLSVNYQSLDLNFADCNSDGSADIIARDEDIFYIFYQQENGAFPRNPDMTFDMKFKDTEKSNEEINVHTLKDINGDGLLDMLATKISASESILNPQSQIQIYLGKKNSNRLFSLKPDQIIISSGVHFEEQLLDFNNDKKMDLAMPSIKLGLMRIIKMLLTKSATIGIKIYQMNEQGLYPESPDLEKKLTLSFSFGVSENSANASGTFPVFELNGDFNGDDNDGKSDIIITYHKQDDSTENLSKTIRVLMNQI